METTNEKLANIRRELKILISWALADREHSFDNHAIEQAGRDHQRVFNLQEALRLIEDCHK